MTDTHSRFGRQLAAIADDAPTEESVLAAVHTGYRRRQSQHRWWAATSVAAVVLVVIAATTLLRPTRSSTPPAIGGSSTVTATADSSGQTRAAGGPATTVIATATRTANVTATGTAAPTGDTVGTRAAPVDLPVPAGLVPRTAPAATSPVTVPASMVAFDTDGPDLVIGPDFLSMNWTGKSPTARETIDVGSGTTGTGQYRGYLVTRAEPPLAVDAPGYDTTATSHPITINGHPARLLDAPKGSYEPTYITPAAQRIAWQLTDGRWIQVWAVGEEEKVLSAFASAIVETPVALATHIDIGITVKGYTDPAVTDADYVSQMGGPSLSLCPPAQGNQNTDPDACLRIWAEVADAGFYNGLAMGSKTQAEIIATTKTVTAGGIVVSVNTELQAAWTRWGPATILVRGPSHATLTAAELAALAASVQLPSSLQVKDEPNQVVESSLGEESTWTDPSAPPQSGGPATTASGPSR